MLAAKKCLQSSLEVRGVGDGKDKKSVLWMVFLCRRVRVRAAVSCISMGISLHI